MVSIYCCQNISFNKEIKSPFSRVIAFGYHDGPTFGVTQCEVCAMSYKFDLLTWDDEQNVRIFSFNALKKASFDELTKILLEVKTPQWPVWIPIWRFDSEEVKTNIEREIQIILQNEATEETLIVASSDLITDILVAKKITTSKIMNVDNWFSFLEL